MRACVCVSLLHTCNCGVMVAVCVYMCSVFNNCAGEKPTYISTVCSVFNNCAGKDIERKRVCMCFILETGEEVEA